MTTLSSSLPVDPRRHLLTELTSAMQFDLANDLPTFLLVTSLEVDPVYQVVQTLSKCPLSPVFLHVLSDDDKHATSKVLRDFDCMFGRCLWGG